MRGAIVAATAVAAWLALPPGVAAAQVITRLPTGDRVVALTFDGCEAGKPAWLDQTIADYLVKEKIPHTIFATGRFAERNRDALAKLAATGLVEIENHSFSHPQHMERLSAEDIRRQVADTDRAIATIAGKPPRFFRFPAGSYDAAALATVEATGHRVVHWEVPSGDPSESSTADRLATWVLANTRPGSIHIFHINGRGRHTAAALPRLVMEMRRRGYRFVRLDEALDAAP